MNLQLDISEKTDYLLITVKGDALNTEALNHYAKKVYDEAIRRGFRKLLIDERLLNPLNVILDQLEHYDYLQNVSEFPQIRVLRIAMIYNKDSRESLNFWELYMSNRGLNVKVFGEMEEAENWLLDK